MDTSNTHDAVAVDRPLQDDDILLAFAMTLARPDEPEPDSRPWGEQAREQDSFLKLAHAL